MKSRRAFTRKDIFIIFVCIVFLLINIGAIGGNGRRRAKDMVCLSNLRQWGAVFEMFTQDNNGYFQASVGDGHTHHWFNALRPYYKNDYKIRCCPTATKPMIDENGNQSLQFNVFSAWGRFWGKGYAPEGEWGSYGINGWVENPPPEYSAVYEDFETVNNWRTPNVNSAGYVPLFMDDLRFNVFPRDTDIPPETQDMAWQGMQHMRRICIDRHNGAINCLFLDFSVRKVGLKELWTLKWHRQFNTNGPWTKAGGVQPDDWPQWMRNFKDF